LHFSLLIPLHNLEERVPKLCQALKSQWTENWQICLLDDGSSDKTHQMLLEHADNNLEIHRSHGLGRSMARNLLASFAKGEYLLFMDGDCIPGSDFLRQWEERFKQGIQVGTGKISYEKSDHFSSWNHFLEFGCGAAKVNRSKDFIPGTYFSSAHFGIQKNLFNQIGGFDSQLSGWGGEDWDLGVRLERSGCKIWYYREIQVWHPIQQSLGIFADRLTLFGCQNLPILIEKHPLEDVFHISLLKKKGMRWFLRIFPWKFYAQLLEKLDRVPWPAFFYRVLYLGCYARSYSSWKDKNAKLSE
jgi:GT2 family glycosyltransferase